MTQRSEKALMVMLTLLAFALRVWQLDGVPPGWRDDELINSLVISQKVLDGNWQVYYADASGHEALYHALNALMLGLFGPNFLGIRLLSVFLGLISVPLTWLLGRKLFGSTVGLVAAAALTLSFWSLMYSRIGIRHILMPVTTLLAFYFFWRGLMTVAGRRQEYLYFGLSGIWLGLGFYVYFASRGVPLILLVFIVYLLLVNRALMVRVWRGLLLMVGVGSLLALPLFLTLNQQPESEARVEELAIPLIAAQAGNFQPLQDHIITTLAMFYGDGDDEWLYNIPHRSVFGLFSGLLFWIGVLLAGYYALVPLLRWLVHLSGRAGPVTKQQYQWGMPAAFCLIWWLAGISPGFISVPPASLGHTILAQPVTFILMGLPLGVLARRLVVWEGAASAAHGRLAVWLVPILALTVLLSLAARDLSDYFGVWPARGMVRFLYRADFHEIADYVNENEAPTDFGIAGLLAGPWDGLALQIGLAQPTAVRPRWFQPDRAIFLEPALSFTAAPGVPLAYEADFTPVANSPQLGGYTLARAALEVPSAQAVCFQNGLCLLSAAFDKEQDILELTWQVSRPLVLPPFQLISNPPPPGVYAGPRLQVFGQRLAADGQYLAGDDGLWVDPYSLHPGDIFKQQHRLPLAQEAEGGQALFGLYDPLTGERILTEDGRDHLSLEIGE